VYKCDQKRNVTVISGDEATIIVKPTDGLISVSASYDAVRTNQNSESQNNATFSKPAMIYVKVSPGPLNVMLQFHRDTTNICQGTVQVDVVNGNHLSKHLADVSCFVNKTLIPCSDRMFIGKYVSRELPLITSLSLNYPNPCTNNKASFHLYPFSKSRFVYCTGEGTLLEVDCPTGFSYLQYAEDCIPTTYVDYSNPCTACSNLNWQLGIYRHATPWDKSRYVQCIRPGQCMVLVCESNQKFDQGTQDCVHA
jgi:hypothetical protein